MRTFAIDSGFNDEQQQAIREIAEGIGLVEWSNLDFSAPPNPDPPALDRPNGDVDLWFTTTTEERGWDKYRHTGENYGADAGDISLLFDPSSFDRSLVELHVEALRPEDIIDGAGEDLLVGGTLNDSLFGGAGVDYLAGGAGSDTLEGGAGYDILAGGDGDDRLIGGAEGDTFFGQEGADRFVIAGGVSWIMDFDAAEGDRIEEKIDLYMRSLHKIRNFRTEAS